MTHARADIEQDAERERCVRTYKLSGPSPKPFRKRPTVEIDGRTIRDVIPNGRDPRDGCVIVLSSGAHVRVTAYPSTVAKHMAEVAERIHVEAAQSSAEQTRQTLVEQTPGQDRARVVTDAGGRMWRLARDVRGKYTVQHRQPGSPDGWRNWPGLTIERARAIVDLADKPTVGMTEDEQVLAAINARLEGRPLEAGEQWRIGKWPIAKMKVKDLLQWKKTYEWIISTGGVPFMVNAFSDEKKLAYISAAIEGRAPEGAERCIIDERPITEMGKSELRVWWRFYAEKIRLQSHLKSERAKP